MIAARHSYIVRRMLCWAGLFVALMLSISLHTERRSNKIALNKRVPIDTHEAVRSIYPLSVIYGGAYSAEELNRARRLDPVVRVHYADFGKTAVAQQTPKDLLMYVSYRKADRVYWTKTKRRIPAGELVLSDGKNLARARCGNRLSFTPQQPTAPEKEPSEEAFNTPETPKIDIPFDAPPLPVTEADLYVPAPPLPADLLLPRMLPPSPKTISASQPIASAPLGGAYGPAQMSPSGFYMGGATLFGGSGLPVLRGTAGLGTPLAVPVISTPEPSTAGLLLFSGFTLLLSVFRPGSFRKKSALPGVS